MIKDLMNSMVICPTENLVTVKNISIGHNRLVMDMSNWDHLELNYKSVNINSQESKSYKVHSMKFNNNEVPVVNTLTSPYIDIYDLNSILDILRKLYNKCEILRRY